ncbi:hypothetical protein D1631_17060 [Chryseobacterium nematophagum]|uniref:Uncharacterized protein n=1 Tax=Chryseobacterium nematophagum TaxID=2305228 RepID=A0A3M7TKR7_9FLAO|nr:hypothetical protein [Chryseobacterium nematophagum]RNA63507.1 hypothetical protein D1631_17060 [Chryseobacterium nematophagum]
MDHLERFKPENLTREAIDEINAMPLEELIKLEDIPGVFLIRDKASTHKHYTGQSTYKNLAVLHKLGFKKRYEVVGTYPSPMRSVTFPEENFKEDFIAPEKQIVNQEGEDSGETSGEHAIEESEEPVSDISDAGNTNTEEKITKAQPIESKARKTK